MQRRRLLRIAGATSTLGFPAGVPDGRTGRSQAAGDCTRPECIHPSLGYTGFSFADLAGLPPDLLPSHRVALVGPSGGGQDGSPSEGGGAGGSEPIPGVHFAPVGLAVESGDVVLFTADVPGHTVTAYHPRFGRQRRVPEGAPPFSSPVLGDGGFWLYRFDDPGVHDLYSAPSEVVGTVARIVVDGGTTGFGPASPRRRPPRLTAGLVLDDGAMAPDAVAERGTVGWDELAPASRQRLVEYHEPLAALVHRFDGVGTDATEPFHLEPGVLVTRFEHEGTGRFVVELVDADGEEPTDRLVDAFDAADGITALGVRGGDYVLDVRAGGAWSVQFAQPTASGADATTLPATADGEGPDYAGPFRFDGLVRATATHHGTGDFRVEGFDAGGGPVGGVIFDEAGRFQGRSTFTHDGPGWLAVNATGRWTVSVEHVG